jgi:hypothetical protein
VVVLKLKKADLLPFQEKDGGVDNPAREKRVTESAPIDKTRKQEHYALVELGDVEDVTESSKGITAPDSKIRVAERRSQSCKSVGLRKRAVSTISRYERRKGRP